jgi:small subunit ribosomal protein S20
VAHHKSAKKRIRQTVTKTLRNKVQRSNNRTIVKALRSALSEKNKELALELLTKAQANLATLAKKGVIKGRAAATRTSKLAKAVNGL